ncbi:unnamed protein product [Candida verbasci]|uniref:BTB domain-containing protein n=1 Tax=Candida verbasci TaxID=1227364 RepID=A0A9W4TY47_9ASCO|nr:unnamed protein product [Candida verbasci]
MVEQQPSSNIKLHTYQKEDFESVPSCKINSIIVPCKNTPYVFLYGGFDDNDSLDGNVYLLKTDTMKWEIDNKVPNLYRDGHSGVYLGNGNILIFGGLLEEEIENPNDSFLMIYNIFDKKWIGPPEFALKNAPTKRSRHACCLSSDGLKVFISGGIYKSNAYNDLYCYDLTTGLWEGPIEFVSRFDHTIIHYNDKIYSFNGLDGDMNHVKSISFYSLKTKHIGEIQISNCSLITPLYNDIKILESKSDPKICIFISLPTSSTKGYLKIESFNFDTFETQNLIDQFGIDQLIPNSSNFIWKSAFVNHDGKLYLLGSSRKSANFGGLSWDDYEEDHEESKILTNVMEINIQNFGISNQESNISSDLLRLFQSQQYTDFEIACVTDEQNRFNFENNQPYETKSILVHKSILLARWAHFQRMISVEMNETIENKMFIPEPVEYVRYLLYYLYSDQLDTSVNYDIVDYSTIVLLSNMYEIRKLKVLIVEKLFTLFYHFKTDFIDDDEHVTILLMLWKDLTTTNETILLSKIIEFIKIKWATVTRSNSFATLTKSEIVKLCQDSANKSQETSRRGSVDTLELIDTPKRNTNSPFLIDSPTL